MALYLREGAEESNIQGLVESAHNDDITPLVKLVFEAQALADSPPSILADGQTMVGMITGALRAVAEDQAGVVEDVCHSNATAIAHTVAELEHMSRKADDVRATLLHANAGMQGAGAELVSNAQHEAQLAEVQDNLRQAAAAVQAAQAVLEQCLITGQLIGQQQLYPALCMLDKIRRKHLGALLSMLPGAAPAAGKGSSSSMAALAAAAAAAGGSSSTRHTGLSGRELAHLQQLHCFFHSLVDDMSANVQRLALRGFNTWLVSMRACARDIGLSAIQSAAVERSLEEQLAGERKALLTALHRPLQQQGAGVAGRGSSSKSVRDIAAELGAAPLRQELLQAAADEAARSAASKQRDADAAAAAASSGGGGGTAGGARGSPGRRGLVGGAGNSSFTAASHSLRDLLKRPSSSSKMPRQLAEAAEAAAAEREQQQQLLSAGHAGDPYHYSSAAAAPAATSTTAAAAADVFDALDLDELFPGEPERAVRELIDLGDRRNTERARRERHRRRRQQQEQQEQQQPSQPQRLSADPSGGLKGLLQLEMAGLYTAVHVARSLGQLDAFRQHYMDQRRLQLTADLQPPSSFLQAYKAYLTQVTGYFVLESFVCRVTEDLLGPQETAQLWGVALRSLKGVLEAAFDSQLGSAPEMLMVKEFVVLMCVALERAGHQVVPVTEILQATTGRYHDLLGAALQAQLAAVVEADVLGELEVRTAEQHRQLADDYCLPCQLEGTAAAASPPGRRAALQQQQQQQLSSGSVPQLPYVAPFTSCVPELLGLIRKFVMDSLTYLRDLYSPWELLPAVFQQRDRMLNKVLVEVLSSKARAVGAAELLRESMKCAANAWALAAALDGLDDWTLAQIRPDVAAAAAAAAAASAGAAQQPLGAEVPGSSSRLQKAGAAAATPSAAAAAAAAKASRLRNRKAVLASGALTNTVQTALKALQESSEREVLRGLTSRIDQLLEASRRADWAPAEPLPTTQSAWVNSLLSYLQEIFDSGIKLLPRSSVVNIVRMALRSTSVAVMRTFSSSGSSSSSGPSSSEVAAGAGQGVKAFNMYSIEKLAHNLLTIERFASRWGVDTVDQELAEPTQLCRLLLSGKPDLYVSVPEVRQQYPAVSPSMLLAALEKYREVPSQAKRKPEWLSKKAAEAAVKQLRAQQQGAGGFAAEQSPRRRG